MWMPSGTWPQRGTKVNGSHHGENPLLRPAAIQIATKSMRLYKQWHRPISKRFIKPLYSISRAASIYSHCCRLSPIPTSSVLSNKADKSRSKFLKATHRTKIRKNEIPRFMVHGGGSLQLVKMCPRWASLSNRPLKHKHAPTDNRRPKHKHTPTDNSYSRPRSSTMSSALSSLAAYADRVSSSSSSESTASSDDEVQVEKVQQSPASGGGGAAAAPKARKSTQKGIAGFFSKPVLL